MFEIINLQVLENNAIYIRYIMDDRVYKMTSLLEVSKSRSQYKKFKFDDSTEPDQHHMNNIYKLIIDRFITASKSELFSYDIQNDSYETYCHGGYLNIKYLMDNYELSNKVKNRFNLVKTFDRLYPFEERRLYENFHNLYFSQHIILDER